jgi:hypothetical protein
MIKPATLNGYSDQYTIDCERVLVTLLRGLGPWKDSVYLVGGLTPRYLVAARPPVVPAHAGTLDVDIVIDLQILADTEAYHKENLKKVNTLSAKADSFFEHPAYWRGYAQLARSRPSALKNVERSVLIPVHHNAALASVHAFRQGLGNLRSARRPELTCVVRGHLNYFTTSLRNFVCEYGDEARPCDVGNRSGKSVVLDHPLNV